MRRLKSIENRSDTDRGDLGDQRFDVQDVHYSHDVNEEKSDFEFANIIDAFRRRKLALLLPIVLLFAVSVVVAWNLPEQYRSTATILVEQQEIPTDFVRPSVTTFADRRIQATTQRVLTVANLQIVIEKLNLYPDIRKNAPIDVVANLVRGNFNVSQVGVRGGTIAFKISYDSSSPDIAQAVASEITELYLKENQKIRTESAEDTTRFLNAEAERLGSEIDELEKKIAAFKEANMGRLPSQLSLNLSLMSRTEQQIQNIEQRIRSLEDRKVSLEIAMAQSSASAQAGPNQTITQLQALRAQLSGLLAAYTPDHPDVARLRSEIVALEAQAADEAGTLSLENELKIRQGELTQALEKLSPEHPDVKRLQRKVEELKTLLERAELTRKTSSTNAAQNFNFLDRQAQYQAAQKEIAALNAERKDLQDKLVLYEERVEQIPYIEREYDLLVRDRNNLLSKYNEIKAKISTARVAENLEKAEKGERFSLIEPARRPVKPFKPNRKKIVAMGLVGSVGAGISMVFIMEFLQKAVYGVRGVTSLLGMPPLAVIPYVENARDRRRRYIKVGLITLLMLVLLFVLLAVGAAVIQYKIGPLEQLWANVEETWAELQMLWSELKKLWAEFLSRV